MRKIIGNCCFVLAGILLLLEMFANPDVDFIGPLCAISMWAGIILRVGDFFKWRAKKHAEGFKEAAQQKADRYCAKCGNGLTEDVVFCPKCGNKVNQTKE